LSLSWRERLKRARKRLMEKLDLTQEDWDYIQENIGTFCSNSDEKIREILESDEKPETQEEIDKLVKGMLDYEFDELTIEIILEIFEKLGYIPKKKRKKKQTEEEKEEESKKQTEEKKEEQSVDSDSDSDSDSDGDTVEQEQEVEVENK